MTQTQFDFYISFGILQQVIESCSEWFVDVLFASSAFFFYFSCFTIFLMVRYLIRPIVGGAMLNGRSDLAKRRRSGKDE